MRSMSCSTVSVTPFFRRRGSRCCSSSSEASCASPIEPAAETKCTSAPADRQRIGEAERGVGAGLVGDHDAMAERAYVVTRAREGGPETQGVHAAGPGDRRAIGPARARAALLPVRARRHDDRIGLRGDQLVRRGLTPQVQFRACPLERRDEILDRVRPAVARRQPGHVAHVPARQLVALVHDDLVPARGRRRRGAQAGGAGADHDHPARRRGLLERAVPERRLAAGGGREHAGDLLRAERPPDADVRADAARGLGLAALARLAHEVRVGEVRARHADDVGRPSRHRARRHGEIDDAARHEDRRAVADELLRPGGGRDRVALRARPSTRS